MEWTRALLLSCLLVTAALEQNLALHALSTVFFACSFYISNSWRGMPEGLGEFGFFSGIHPASVGVKYRQYSLIFQRSWLQGRSLNVSMSQCQDPLFTCESYLLLFLSIPQDEGSFGCATPLNLNIDTIFAPLILVRILSYTPVLIVQGRHPCPYSLVWHGIRYIAGCNKNR
ncbi:hypothetical protein BC939DRAFT_251340 [Gamsiella multidivaricata]|uniref:uncharacterized protein n=1 Tax=Gamsiella multidivaricata TaxID=101098 RepID=UPI0022203246|nr:uncharacterized protein BC939DRAFT_251340 [Gamsiella multidivaricata]KAI7819716.1 hypothetical protein BC939DRAFT_251340 [Gamsiella multidivaricata]